MIIRLENTLLPVFQICKKDNQYIFEFPKRGVRYPITHDQLLILQNMLEQGELIPLVGMINGLSVEQRELIKKHIEVLNV